MPLEFPPALKPPCVSKELAFSATVFSQREHQAARDSGDPEAAPRPLNARPCRMNPLGPPPASRASAPTLCCPSRRFYLSWYRRVPKPRERATHSVLRQSVSGPAVPGLGVGWGARSSRNNECGRQGTWKLTPPPSTLAPASASPRPRPPQACASGLSHSSWPCIPGASSQDPVVWFPADWEGRGGR